MIRLRTPWLTLTLVAGIATNALSSQDVSNRALERAVDENARTAGVDSAWVAKHKERARALDADGADADAYLAKLSEGLAKRVPEERLGKVLSQYAQALRDAHHLAAEQRMASRSNELTAAQLLMAGASEDQVRELMRAGRGQDDASRRFQAAALGAVALRGGGADWKAATRFQATLAGRKDLSSGDIEDVNTAVAAAVADKLVAPADLETLAERELKTPERARAFVSGIRATEGRADKKGRVKAAEDDERADAVKAGKRGKKGKGGDDSGGDSDDDSDEPKSKPNKGNRPSRPEKD